MSAVCHIVKFLKFAGRAQRFYYTLESLALQCKY